MDWIKEYGLMTGISDQLKGVDDTLKKIDDILTAIDSFNSIISTIVNTISTISSIPAVDPNFIALQEIQKIITKWVDDFIGQGVYCLPVFPSEVIGGLDSVKGGINNFKQRVIDSFYDVYDDQRPTFNYDNYVAAIIVVYDTSSLADIMTVVNSLLNMFKVFTESYKAGIKTAPLEDLKVVVGDKKVQLQWFPNPNGLQPDSYEIYRSVVGAVGGESRSLIGKVYPVLYPIIFEDTGLINNTPYVYTIIPYFLTLKQDEVAKQATPVENQFSEAIADTTCSNLNCVLDSNNNPVYSCKLGNPAFDKIENINGGFFPIIIGANKIFVKPLCRAGKNICSQYTNKQCKYDNGTRCISLDFTSSKTRSYDKTGNNLSVANTSLYFSPYCKNGANAQVCDGYVESKLYFNGTPPNWQALSMKRFLPAELSPVLDQTQSFINSMVSTTQKADTAVKVFGNELSNAASSLKSTLSEIRDMISIVNEIFKTPLPFVYVLEIPTQVGGIDSLVAKINAAQQGPKPDKNAYTVGFALVFGSKNNIVVDAAFNAFKEIF